MRVISLCVRACRLRSVLFFSALALIAAGAAVESAASQTLAGQASRPGDPIAGLPDAPGLNAAGGAQTPPQASAFSAAVVPSAARSTSQPEASVRDRHIQPDQAAPPLAAGDKVRMGLRGVVSPFAVMGWFTAAGYEQLANSSPNWGTDRGAFGQRLGTGAVRATTEGLLSNSVMAPLLHEDPRYYRLGRRHHPAHRFLYAITRPLITRTDGGRASINFALLGGNLAGSALTNAYYPAQNRGPRQTMETFGGSLAGSAFGNLITEFLGGYLSRLTR